MTYPLALTSPRATSRGRLAPTVPESKSQRLQSLIYSRDLRSWTFNAGGAMSEKQADKPSLTKRLMTRLTALIEAPRPEPMSIKPERGSGPIGEDFEDDLKAFEARVERRKSFHDDASKIRDLGLKALRGEWKPHQVPSNWDGRAAERIAAVLANHLT